MLRPAVFKVNDPSLFEVNQRILPHAIIGRAYTEDSARQNVGFQAKFLLHQGFKGLQHKKTVTKYDANTVVIPSSRKVVTLSIANNVAFGEVNKQPRLLTTTIVNKMDKI